MAEDKSSNHYIQRQAIRAGIEDRGQKHAQRAQRHDPLEQKRRVFVQKRLQEFCQYRCAGMPNYLCSVFPQSSSTACGSKSKTARSDSTAPFGLPGKLRISARPHTPHTARLNAASGVCFAPSARMRSGIPSTIREQTARVASGVTSRSAMPVPPVVTTRSHSFAKRRNSSAILVSLSGTTSVFTTSNRPASSLATAGPERSSRLRAAEESLTVNTAAVGSLPIRSLSHWVAAAPAQGVFTARKVWYFQLLFCLDFHEVALPSQV